jgi:tRNA-splicing ligase RtcB
METKKQLTIEKVDDYHYTIPQQGGMQVPGLLYANQKLIDDIKRDESPRQVANVAHLPGIIKYSLAMPDMHWGYGFPIGGVAAFDLEEGIISPGGVGYDINCGCRILRTGLTLPDVSFQGCSIRCWFNGHHYLKHSRGKAGFTERGTMGH